MRILQISSDWKWTGPAEPMLRLALALREAGHEVALACPDPPEPGLRSLSGEARAAGLAPRLVLRPGRGVRPLADRSEVARLRALLHRERFDLVHVWHTRDHVLALRAARSPGGRRTPLVRSWRMGGDPPANPLARWLLGPGADGLLCVSPGTAARFAGLRRGRPVRGAFGAVDLVRFRPAPPDPELRASLGLPREPVLGVVARVQRHRRFDLLLESLRRLAALRPGARLLVVGRGTHLDEVARRPARALGLGDRVVFAGYRSGDYLDVLRQIAVLVFLVPGSDGTCRAVLEAAACGIPAITSRRGALPEIVADGRTGRVVDEDPEALASAAAELLADADLRARMGAAARHRAERLFTPERFAEEAQALYASVLPESFSAASGSSSA